MYLTEILYQESVNGYIKNSKIQKYKPATPSFIGFIGDYKRQRFQASERSPKIHDIRNENSAPSNLTFHKGH